MLSDKERAEKYRKTKTETHKRISPWFSHEEIEIMDEQRGGLSRTEWVKKVVMDKIKRIIRKAMKDAVK